MSDNLPEVPPGEFVLFRSEDGQTLASNAVLSRIRCGYLRLKLPIFIR